MCWLSKTLADPNHKFNNMGFSIYSDPTYQGMANRCCSLLTPFTGPHVTERQDAFNYFHSSSHMSIEGAFGELINRWGIYMIHQMALVMLDLVLVLMACRPR